jgi:hypothetical protein
MGAKGDFFQRGSFVMGDGIRTHFWEDSWLGDRPLSVQYPTLFNTVRTKEVIVADVLTQT